MADLVHRRGYLAVGVEDVCKAAGVKKGSFYHFFSSKRELMLAALERQQHMAHAHVLATAFQADLPPLQRIDRLFAMVAGMETSNKNRGGRVLGCPFGNIAVEMSASEPKLARRADQAFCGFASFIADALREAKKRGEIERDVNIDETADAIVAYFEGLAVLAKTRNDPALLRRLGRHAVLLAKG
ncbi:MAG TPA: TetR/AcrR family transcriptional regulator [Thermoanaerobaculia bacterium]|nr:TetR/AcrR family transcriptional regulator [Thermoanaerobaculia bacterium]